MCTWRYFLLGINSNVITLFIDYAPIETSNIFYYNISIPLSVYYGGFGTTINGTWIHLTLIWVNIATHKLYLSGKLLTTVTNTNIGVNFGKNYCQAYLRGYTSDMRLYGREVTANEILNLYKQGNIDNNLTLNLEETV
jgi:hypothetical protein